MNYKVGDLIQRKDDHDIWGIVKSFSDDESIVYYSKNGTHLTYCHAGVDEMELG